MVILEQGHIRDNVIVVCVLMTALDPQHRDPKYYILKGENSKWATSVNRINDLFYSMCHKENMVTYLYCNHKHI